MSFKLWVMLKYFITQLIKPSNIAETPPATALLLMLRQGVKEDLYRSLPIKTLQWFHDVICESDTHCLAKFPHHSHVTVQRELATGDFSRRDRLWHRMTAPGVLLPISARGVPRRSPSQPLLKVGSSSDFRLFRVSSIEFWYCLRAETSQPLWANTI